MQHTVSVEPIYFVRKSGVKKVLIPALRVVRQNVLPNGFIIGLGLKDLVVLSVRRWPTRLQHTLEDQRNG